jgi:hypothetical protein
MAKIEGQLLDSKTVKICKKHADTKLTKIMKQYSNPLEHLYYKHTHIYIKSFIHFLLKESIHENKFELYTIVI